MKFIRLCSVHIKYHLNYKMLIFIGLFLLVLIFNFIYNTNVFEGKEYQLLFFEKMYYNYHLKSSFFVYIGLMIFSSFVGLLGEKDYDEIYLAFCNKEIFYLTKILSDILIILLISLTTLVLYNFFGSLLLSYYTFDIRIVLFFFNIFLQSVIILLFSLSINCFLKNYFSGVLTLFIFWFVKMIVDDFDINSISPLIKLLQYFLPVLLFDGKEYFFLYSSLYAFLIILLLIFINVELFNKKV